MEYPEQWQKEGSFLSRIFIFNNFVEAVQFVNKLLPLVEKYNHHPDIEIFSYKKVKIKLTTHDLGHKVTEKDIELAKKINRIKQNI